VMLRICIATWAYNMLCAMQQSDGNCRSKGMPYLMSELKRIQTMLRGTTGNLSDKQTAVMREKKAFLEMLRTETLTGKVRREEQPDSELEEIPEEL
jgi:hypothetical protein